MHNPNGNQKLMSSWIKTILIDVSTRASFHTSNVNCDDQARFFPAGWISLASAAFLETPIIKPKKAKSEKSLAGFDREAEQDQTAPHAHVIKLKPLSDRAFDQRNV